MKLTDAITLSVMSCLLATVLPGTMFTAAAGSGPSIFLPGTNFGLKSVAEGAVAKHAFVVRNLGDTPI
jgi:hypothetical protein